MSEVGARAGDDAIILFVRPVLGFTLIFLFDVFFFLALFFV